MGRKENLFNIEEKGKTRLLGKIAMLSFIALNMIIHGVSGARGGSEYLYTDKEEAIDVFEYIKPEKMQNSFFSLQKENTEPNFLASPDYGDRIIVFYSPWCGHCINYAPEYMKLATETKKTNPEINFYAVSCIAHKDLCKKFSIRKFPTLLIIKADSITSHNLSLTQLKEGTITVPDQFRKSRNTLNDEQFLSEILASYGMNIRTGVYDGMKATLAEPRRQIFSNWLRLIASTLPEEWPVKKMTAELLENFESLAEDKLNMYSVVDKYSKERPSCYECSLWHLLHVITVRTAERSERLPAVERQALAQETVSTIEDFLENFFSCIGCKKSFTEIKESCWNGWCHSINAVDAASAGKEWQNIALWMWDLHNYYKREMKKETNLNQGEISKADVNSNASNPQWPSREECKECWKVDGGYTRSKIYAHLKKTYWHESETEVKKEVIHPSISLKAEEGAESFISATSIVCISFFSFIIWRF